MDNIFREKEGKMGENNDNQEEDTSRLKTMHWAKHVLETYYTQTAQRREGRRNQRPTDHNPADLVEVNVLDFDIDSGLPGDTRISTLSELLSLSVQYTLNGCNEVKTENWIVKIPPNDKADKEMAQMAQVDQREIQFYEEALPELEEFCRSQNAVMSLAVPKFYFGNRHQEVRSEDGESLIKCAESVLVLDDMRPKGFAMKNFTEGLSLQEAFAALREIATIHATSWAMQETQNIALDEKWDYTYRPQKAASAYKVMIEQGFPNLAEFLRGQLPDGAEILNKLDALHPRAAELLCELLEPPPPPAPSCLTHMDFWCNNLLFRRRTPPDGSAAGKNGNCNGNGVDPCCSSSSSGSPGSEDGVEDDGFNSVECLIVDWQMMAISRPTHDVALLLFTSLTPEVRRANTRTLLHYYWKIFQITARKLNVEIPFEFGIIENEFKKSQVLALLLVIGSIDLAIESEKTQVRLLQALRDMANEELI